MYIVVSKQKGRIVGANSSRDWGPGVVADEDQVRKIVEKLRAEVVPVSSSFLDALRDGVYTPPVIYLRKNARAAAKKLSDMHGSFEWEVYQVAVSNRKVGKRPIGWRITVGSPAFQLPSAWNLLPPADGLSEDDYVKVADTCILKTRKAARKVLEDIEKRGDTTMGYKVHPVYNEEEVSNG